tara:strand:- start:109 stop:312 length:204 start_codon:yes stop_codon:yes gene_type:complete
MKAGTYVEHFQWGKGIVVEELLHIAGDFCPPAVLVLWNKPRELENGNKLITLRIYEKDLTIISEVEE